MKNKILILMMAMLSFSLFSCNNDDELPVPSFGEIKISPEKAEYKVGDQITLSIEQLSDEDATVKDAKYWFYYDYNTKAMFVTRPEGSNTLTSPTITLTSAGDVELSFWGRLEYAQFKYAGVEKTIKIKVTE